MKLVFINQKRTSQTLTNSHFNFQQYTYTARRHLFPLKNEQLKTGWTCASPWLQLCFIVAEENVTKEVLQTDLWNYGTQFP